MDASTVGDLFARERRSEAPALVDATGRVYDYHWLCTSVWKAGNFLRHAGVRRGVTVGVVGEGPLAVLSAFGTALLEGAVRFDPPADLAAAGDVRALVSPVDAIERYALPRGAQRVGYGGDPDDPAVHHLEVGLWSENPSFPPLSIDPETPLLADDEGTYTHGAALSAARDVVDERGLDRDARVAVAGPLGDPRVVVAGVLAPLVVGGTVVLADGSPDPDADLVVGDGPSAGADADPDRLSPSAVDLDRRA